MVFYRGEERQIERITLRLFGRRLRTWEYAGLAGAPDGAQVEFGIYHDQLYVEMGDPAANRYRVILLVRRAGAEVVIVMEGFHIHERDLQGKGFGLKIFHRQLANAKALGVDRIETTAGRRNDENGYYTWPRFGFDGPLSQRIIENLPLGLEHVRTVLELIECEKGRLWWKQHGETIDVTFDVADRSRSRKVF
ncbi:unnamed protein product, partial [marine sediment metagenome]